MLATYVIVSIRKFQRHKINTFTRLFSLSVGIFSLLFIVIYVHEELSYDSFHKNKSRIVKINTEIAGPAGSVTTGLTATPVAPFLAAHAPEVEGFARIHAEHSKRTFRNGDVVFNEQGNIGYADPSFFKLFDFNLLDGDVETALTRPDHAVITERAAMKYFGSSSVVGKTILCDGKAFIISGLLQNIPSNSQFQFDFLISMETFFKDKAGIHENWGWFPMNTYLLLVEGATAPMVEGRLSGIEAYAPENTGEERFILSATPFDRLHFSEVRLGELGVKGSLTDIWTLVVVGLLILVLGVFNYVNLSTAQMSVEHKSVSVRKTLGATFREIFGQYFVESGILCAAACFISFFSGWLLFDRFEGFMNQVYDVGFLQSYWTGVFVILFLVILSLLSSTVPAIRFSNIPVVSVMQRYKIREGIISARSLMIVSQFGITSLLMITTLVIYGQLDYLQSRNPGVDTKHKIVIDYGINGSVSRAFRVVKSELSSVPGVRGVTFSSHVPGEMPHGVTTTIRQQSGMERSGEINLMLVDYDFLDDYGIELVSGRTITEGMLSDSSPVLLINEATLEAFGYTDPEEVIGQSFEQWGGNGRVAGVFRDFSYLSLHHAMGRLSLKMWPEEFQKITVTISGDDIPGVISGVGRKWTALFPDIPFEYYFVDDLFYRQYAADRRFASIIGIFTGISVSIGVVGLVAFATFWCERRKKEISVRKILGAGSINLLLNLFRSFSLPVLISFMLALPVALHVGNRWLNQFAYRNPIQWHHVLIPCFALVVLITLSIVFQVVKVVMTNPVENLRED